MEFLKIILLTSNVKKVMYTKTPRDYQSLNQFIEINLETNKQYRKHWIDDEGDKVQIENEYSYQVFLEISNQKKIFLTDVKVGASEENIRLEFGEKLGCDNKTSQNHGRNSNAFGDASQTIHSGIKCDNCEMFPLIGYRYKCLQCKDYDLCMKCESKFVHSSHKMIRLPYKISKQEGKNYCAIFGISGTSADERYENIESNMNADTSFVQEKQRRLGKQGHNFRRRHRENRGSNFISTLFQMMTGMVECETYNQHEKNLGAQNIQTKKENVPVNNKAEKKNVSDEGFYDPECIKAGIEILSHFSQIFSRNIPPNKECNDTDNQSLNKTENEVVENTDSNLSRKNSLSMENYSNKMEKNNCVIQNNLSNVELYENTSTGSTCEDSNKNFDIGVDKSTNAEAFVDSSQIISENLNKNHEEPDWAIIEKPLDAEKNQENKRSEDLCSTSFRFESLEELISESKIPHISSNEIESKKSLTNIKNGQEKPETTDVKKFHIKPHINDSVVAMMAMGFSNEGGWLTHLLELVEGNISLALDLMKPGKQQM